jgi:purine-nucleoside phosphorylase
MSDSLARMATLKDARAFLETQFQQKHPDVALSGNLLQSSVVLGSGLGAAIDEWESRFPCVLSLPYAAISGMPTAHVQGHGSVFKVFQVSPTHRTGVFCGRTHAYETTDLDRVVFPIRLAKALGAEILILTNAAGGIRDDLNPGQLVLITDHLNLTGLHPLQGQNLDALGPRFYDMTEAYSKRLRDLAQAVAKQQETPLSQGVYAWLLGPSYETPAEIRMLRTLGADVVGMSTVPEVLAARHMGLEVMTLSCITNKAAGLGQEQLSHQEVMETAQVAQKRFNTLLQDVLVAL